MILVNCINQLGQGTSVNIDKNPGTCPLCHNKITAVMVTGFLNPSVSYPLRMIYRCPDESCRNPFIAYYKQPAGIYEFAEAKPADPIEINFSEIIAAISPNFIEIYNQSYTAEIEGLDIICGAGYRKALEFLIKDYVISKTPAEAEKIKKESLGTVIKNRVDHAQLKLVAQRAAWLGNDEVHYERIWEGKDLDDLKDLINLTIRWIETDKLTEKLLEDMPEVERGEKLATKSPAGA